MVRSATSKSLFEEVGNRVIGLATIPVLNTSTFLLLLIATGGVVAAYQTVLFYTFQHCTIRLRGCGNTQEALSGTEYECLYVNSE